MKIILLIVIYGLVSIGCHLLIEDTKKAFGLNLILVPLITLFYSLISVLGKI